MTQFSGNLTDSLNKFKKIFERMERYSIGVDIGTTRVKIVQIERSAEKYLLKNCFSIKLRDPMLQVGKPGLILPEAGQVLKEIFKAVGIKQKKINVAVPGFASLITTLELSVFDDSEIEPLISVEAPKYIPIPLKDVIYGWQVLPNNIEPGKEKATVQTDSKDDDKEEEENGPQIKKILLVALMQEVSKAYSDVLSDAGFDLQRLEVDSFSIKRALVGNDLAGRMVLDIGEKVTNIIIMSGGNIVISRNIDVAGGKITEMISKGMAIVPDRAEQLKYTGGVELDKKFGSPLVGAALSKIVSEAKRSLEIFKQTYPDRKIEELILNGGTVLMPGSKAYFERNIRLRVNIANPWQRIECPQNLLASLQQKSPFFTVAAGLALSGFEE